ncbi:hypothetical protein [Phenylobacterium sp.]|uniref:hypothetical protein n=1 Tax=Phenylobacterium sp. TaxID=1871053 RepID=UPI002EDB0F30
MTVCALAVWRGRDDERLASAGFLAGWAMTLVVFRARSEETQWAVLAIDVLLLGLFIWIALRSPRFWPLMVAALQALAVAVALAKALDPRITGWAYLTASLVFQYLALLTIGYGAITAPRRYAEIEEVPADIPGATRR